MPVASGSSDSEGSMWGLCSRDEGNSTARGWIELASSSLESPH